MATLTAADRQEMPQSAFAGPGHSFPINDPTHARKPVQAGQGRRRGAAEVSRDRLPHRRQGQTPCRPGMALGG